MADLLVRDLSPETIDKLKRGAERHNRSLEDEARSILEDFARADWEGFAGFADAFREKMLRSGREFSDSTELVREDRDR